MSSSAFSVLSTSRHVQHGRTRSHVRGSLQVSCSYPVVLNIVSVINYRNASRSTLVRAGGDEEQDVTDMFQKELEKRNISSIEDIQEPPARPGVIAPPSFSGGADPAEDDSQLERSRNLNSEGLEGLVPRGSQLLQLGASFFLAFGPFILFVLLSFGAVYSVFGDLFVHSGSPSSGVPQYVDPMDLLSEPTVDPMIPM